MRILVVDDEEDARRFLKDLLCQASHQVTTASSAVHAIALVQMTSFDLVLLDLMMPGIDGHQFAQFMSSHWDTFDVPVVVVSCRTDAESKSWAKLNNCVRYVEKPFDSAELLDVVRDVERGLSEKR
jgi:DNA-binding response OmpR family regulator